MTVIAPTSDDSDYAYSDTEDDYFGDFESIEDDDQAHVTYFFFAFWTQHPEKIPEEQSSLSDQLYYTG